MGAGHHGGHAHGHGVAAGRAGARHKPRLLAAFALLLGFTVVEVVGAFVTGSLALLSDAGHMLTDVLGLGMALAAIHLADRAEQRTHHTFGLYRLEILAALANAVLLFGLALYVAVEALRRFADPAEVTSGAMLVVAVLGLAANVAAFFILRDGARESLNVEGAYLEVVADTLGSLGVIVAAIAIGATGWEWIDPAVGVAVGVFILPRTWKLAGRAIRILVQAAPPGTDIEELGADLGAIDGVVDVHDLHVWTLTSDMDVASAHIMVRAGTDPHGVLDQARVLLRDRYSIDHATFQVEPDDHHGCDDVNW